MRVVEEGEIVDGTTRKHTACYDGDGSASRGLRVDMEAGSVLYRSYIGRQGKRCIGHEKTALPTAKLYKYSLERNGR